MYLIVELSRGDYEEFSAEYVSIEQERASLRVVQNQFPDFTIYGISTSVTGSKLVELTHTVNFGRRVCTKPHKSLESVTLHQKLGWIS